jgi:hypothetical protein
MDPLPAYAIRSSGSFPVFWFSFESNAKLPAAVVKASATPLFVVDPLIHAWASGVMSTKRN